MDFLTYNKSFSIVPKHKNIILKKYVPDIEAKNTPFRNYKHLNQIKYLKFRSDIARILFLNNYGGIYYDLDMILLKDLNPLLGVEFCYSWSNRKEGNNGILRLFKNSKAANFLIQNYKKYEHKNFSISYNHHIFTKDLDIYCFPSVFFDPVWILFDTKKKSKHTKLDNFDDFFKKTNENINSFFNKQIFAYHWHSRNNAVVEENSYYEKIEKSFR